MECFFKISVLLLLSLTWTTKTNSYKASHAASEEEANEVVVAAKEQSEQKEMEGFWLTKILMVEE